MAAIEVRSCNSVSVFANAAQLVGVTVLVVPNLLACEEYMYPKWFEKWVNIHFPTQEAYEEASRYYLHIQYHKYKNVYNSQS